MSQESCWCVIAHVGASLTFPISHVVSSTGLRMRLRRQDDRFTNIAILFKALEFAPAAIKSIKIASNVQ